jgi:hypothetical protein
MLLISACGNGARIAAVLPWVRDGSPNWTPATREWLTMSNTHVVLAVRNYLSPGTYAPTYLRTVFRLTHPYPNSHLHPYPVHNPIPCNPPDRSVPASS